MRALLITAAVAVCLLPPVATAQFLPMAHASLQPTCIVSKEEARVYVDLLERDSDPSWTTVMVTTTQADVDVDYHNLHFAAQGFGVPKEVREDFKVKNRIPCRIRGMAGKNLRFITKRQHDQIFENGWEAFYRRFGKRAQIVFVSRVGFDKEGTKALLYVSSAIGPMAASGALYFLEKESGKWVIRATKLIWMT